MLNDNELLEVFNTLSDDQKEALYYLCGFILIGQEYKVGNKKHSISQILKTMNCDQLKAIKAFVIMTINDIVTKGD